MSQMYADSGRVSQCLYLRHLRNLRTIIGILLVQGVICCTGALGAPPNVKQIFPSGGQRAVATEIKASGDISSWPLKTWTSHPGLQVTCGDEKGKLAVTVAADTRPGVYFIRLYDDEGAARPLPFVVGNLPEVVEKSSNDSPGKAETLPSSLVTVNGRLEKRDDVDVYAVELSAGQTVVASVVANEKLASPMDGVLQILSGSGSVLAQNDEWHGMDPQLVFTAPSYGRYLVRIFAFPAQPDSRIGLAGGEEYLYRLTITTGPFVDYTWPLAVRQRESSDVELIGWNIDAATRRQNVNADAHPFAISGDQLAGQLSLGVEPHGCLIEAKPGNPGEPQTIELPATVSGRLQSSGERDAYAFQAKRDEAVLFQLDGRDLGSPLDAVVEVTDAKGKSLVRADDTNRRRDPEVSWKAPDDGTYQVVVSDLHGRGGERFFYRLRAIPAKPDFRITSAEHAVAGSVGKPPEIALEIDRQHGFDQEVVIKAEGLPDSVIAEPVTSSKVGNSVKKVTLKLKADAPYSGPLRIVGVGQGTDMQSREATFKAAGEADIAVLWLTIKPDKQE
jgi:hypothetical protein